MSVAVNNVDVTVFLVSLKAGGVALNLTEASRVYLMDSWWNPAVEFRELVVRLHSLPSADSINRGYGSDSPTRSASTG